MLGITDIIAHIYRTSVHFEAQLKSCPKGSGFSFQGMGILGGQAVMLQCPGCAVLQ